ncbi:Transcription termination protein NusA [hydrothermal vent metagenome]|uniref:Transcription termination protein NusA n=1 Tax=hydrothermal vent metagenome TaxID=652676 RepID=A0A3B1DIX7_9ZZZZ
MSSETSSLLEQIAREKGLDKSVLVDALKSAVEAAARKRMPLAKELHSEFNDDTGEVEIYVEKTVVQEVTQADEEISLDEAQAIAPEVELGEQVLVQQILGDYGRIAAQLAKQVILQKVREAEVELIYNDFIEKKGELINGIMQRQEHGDLIVDLGKAEGVLPRREQVFRETFNRGERIRAYILDVRKTSKNAMVILSRTHIGLIERLFEMEVPEISEGMVDIMGIVREPNGRTKIAVKTNDRDIDAVGACVGMRGMRVQSIVQELRGEKIDIVEFSEDPEVFIRNALSPAKVSRIIVNESERHMTIIVQDDQMSLAIGKKGQNVRLAAKLVKWRIDIKGQGESVDLGESSGLFAPKKPAEEVNFLDLIKDTKGLGEKIMAALFEGNVVSFEEALKREKKGLTKLPGIGPKKAEAIIELAEEHKPAPIIEPEEEVALVDEELEAAEPESEAVATEEEEIDEETVEEADEDDDDEDIPVDELVNIDNAVIETLKQNEFQTLEELSVTPLEDLLAISGIDEETAQSILDQAKQRIEELE